MAISTLPDISTLPSLPPSDCYQILDTLFEPSQALHALADSLLLQKTCTSYQALIDLVRGRLTALASSQTAEDRAILLNILGSHPRLGEKAAPSTTAPEKDALEKGKQPMSELSKAEQASLNQGSVDQLRTLNAEYEEKFPGLRYVYEHTFPFNLTCVY